VSPILNYTTSVPVSRTITVMQEILAKAGASQVSVTMDGGKPSGMWFVLPTPAGPREFSLPVDVDAVQKRLRSGKQGNRVDARREQAERVAWRIVKDWLEAQVALIEAAMATLDEVMLPYLLVAPDRTLREQWRAKQAIEMQS
jgi:hypothetical protein